jgi:8-oxo-dGTP diphosphatase
VIIRIKKELVSKVIIFDGREVLLLKRDTGSVTERSPWTWDLPGGHLDAGETFQQAAIREVFEETKLILTDISYVGRDSNIGKLTYFYTAEEWDGEIKLSKEHEEYKWVSSTELDSYEESIGSMYYKMVLKALKTRK